MRHQFSRMNRFGQVIIHAGFIAFDLVINLTLGGKHENRRDRSGGLVAQAAGNFIPIHIRHHDVQNDQIRLFIPSHGQCLGAIVSRSNLIALPLKHQPHKAQCFQIIIDDQNFLRHNNPPWRMLWPGYDQFD